MIYHEIDDISTGGGCEHILIKYPAFKLCVLINNDHQKVPEQGESYDIGVYHLEDEGWMGEYIEGCFESFDNFDRATIVERTLGYLEGKGFKQNYYTMECLHQSVNDIHEQWDDGKIEKEDAIEMLRNCCEKFLEDNK